MKLFYIVRKTPQNPMTWLFQFKFKTALLLKPTSQLDRML